MKLHNLDYDNELNNRLRERTFPSNSLQPLFDFRPVSTKYTWFQTVEEYPKASVHQNNYIPYSPSNVFNPGDRAPVDFFLSSIDTESKLRHQFMALQKSDQALYVPNIESDLYNNPMSYKDKKNYKEVNNIKDREQKTTDKNKDLFNNPTRSNIKK
jgi:hypothetical protein